MQKYMQARTFIVCFSSHDLLFLFEDALLMRPSWVTHSLYISSEWIFPPPKNFIFCEFLCHFTTILHFHFQNSLSEHSQGPQTANHLNSQSPKCVIGYLRLQNLSSDVFRSIPLIWSIGFLHHPILQANPSIRQKYHWINIKATKITYNFVCSFFSLTCFFQVSFCVLNGTCGSCSKFFLWTQAVCTPSSDPTMYKLYFCVCRREFP